jgi:PAS domain S-box-containing protein
MSSSAIFDGSPQGPAFPKRQLGYAAGAVVLIGAIALAAWPEGGRRLFASDFLPHAFCYLQQPGLVWTNVIADALISLSYLVISATLVYLIYQGRQDVPFRWMFLAFGLFIVACGATHLMDVVTMWMPMYVLAAAGKAFTAIVSLTMAVALPFTTPRILAMLQNARASEQATDRLRLAMESGKTVGWDWDVKTGRDSWFGDLPTMYGIPSHSHEGSPQEFLHFLHPDDRERVWGSIAASLKDGRPYEAEFRVVRPDGAVRWVADKGKVYFSPHGDPKQMLGIATDITELKRTQEALQVSEERLRLAAQAGKMFAYTWHADSDLIERSGECAQILGIDARTCATGRQVVERAHPEDREMLRAKLAELTPEKPNLQVSYRMIRPDGSIVWVDRNSRAYFDEHGALTKIIGMVADVTERKLADETLASMSRRLIEAQENERARIARDLHDDIGQRLAVSAIGLERLKQFAASFEEDAHHCIAEIQKQLHEISSNVHTLSHELHSSTLELLGLVAAMKDSCRELGAQQKAQIHFRHEDIPVRVPRDISLCLFRILQEALHNAVKHSGVREFEVELRGTPEAIHLTIRDEGVGFDPKVALGTPGLGLTSMRERLKLVHGELLVESQLRTGTTIHARVPFFTNAAGTATNSATNTTIPN